MIGFGVASLPSNLGVTSSPPPGGIGSLPSGTTSTAATPAPITSTNTTSCRQLGRSAWRTEGTSNSSRATSSTHGPAAR